MIEINLLPEELRQKDRKFSVDTRYIVFLIPAVVSALVCVHLALSTVLIVKTSQLGYLNAAWQKLGGKRELLEKYKKEDDLLSQDSRMAQQLSSESVRWSEKLNTLSLALPAGVWFNKLTVSGKDFVLRGSVVSLQKDEMTAINKFLDSLKNDPAFFNTFVSLELESVKRDAVGGYDVVAFTLKGALK